MQKGGGVMLTIKLRWHYAVLILAAIAVHESLCALTGFSLAKSILTLLSSFVFTLLPLLGELFMGILGNDSEGAKKFRKSCHKVWGKVLHFLRVETSIGAIALIFCMVVLSSFAATAHPYGTIINKLGETATPNESVPISTENPDHSEPLRQTPNPNKDVNQNTPDPSPSPQEEPDYNDNQEGPNYAQLKILDIELNVSSHLELYQDVFFLSGTYPIETWSPEAVLKSVRATVEELRGHNLKTPVMDQTILNRIYYASEDEKKIKTYIQLQAVIDERETLYTSYPFRDLAWLIRENYGGFGDAYNYQHYSRDTAIYYYANSIQWGLRTLEFNSDDELPEDLYVLVERYQKIEDMSPIGSNIHIYAGLLANAFLTLYNECV